MTGGPHHSRFVLERDPKIKRTYVLHGDGPPVGWLQLGGGFGRTASVSVTGDRWDLTYVGMFRPKLDVVSHTTGQLLAQMKGPNLVVVGGPNLQWQRPTYFNFGGTHAFVRSDGVTVAHFSRLLGWFNRSLEIDLIGGDWHVGLICAFVGSWKMLLQAQANGSSAAVGGAGASGA